MRYIFTVEGTAASGAQTFTCTGELEDLPGNFSKILDKAMNATFMQLTDGKAVFGTPGVGCHGPYGITRFQVAIAPDG
jgi:hypothetical protein